MFCCVPVRVKRECLNAVQICILQTAIFLAETKSYLDFYHTVVSSKAHRPEGIDKPLHTVGRLIPQYLNASFHLYHTKTDNNIRSFVFFALYFAFNWGDHINLVQ